MTAVWAIVALVTLLRAVAAFTVPLTGDEAYYWEWSRHLAFGYVDHPPLVAWMIAAFSVLGRSPGIVRLGSVACGIVATLALAACATEAARGDRRAGAAAALVFSLTPATLLAFTAAGPDAPYLACWCVGLWLAERAFARGERRTFGFLGLALGGVLLSRMTGFALLFGVAVAAVVRRERGLWRGGLGAAFAIAALCFLPFLAWNAQHHWATLAFTFAGRHVDEGFSLGRVLRTLAVQAAAYSPGIWLAALLAPARARNALVVWTAAPLFALVVALALVERVEVNWLYGPFASACAGIGVAWASLSARARAGWAAGALAPAAILMPLLFAAALAPGPMYALFRAGGHSLTNTGPFEIYTYAPLARDVKALAQRNDAVVMTDGYGFSSILDFDAGIPPVLIGYDRQGAEGKRWYPSSQQPANALFVDKTALGLDGAGGRPEFRERFAAACAHVRDGGVLRYSYPGVPARTYYLTWCDGVRPAGIAIMRWERPA